ncbi:hypothetical protein GALL_286500 [mine drainage metagenome]|uniref:Uncharacterized protein n=1 Tax=mine drainage metagenome TaxID=410659 RepID=A0A1J5R0J4_9ZZZZ
MFGRTGRVDVHRAACPSPGRPRPSCPQLLVPSRRPRPKRHGRPPPKTTFDAPTPGPPDASQKPRRTRSTTPAARHSSSSHAECLATTRRIRLHPAAQKPPARRLPTVNDTRARPTQRQRADGTTSIHPALTTRRNPCALTSRGLTSAAPNRTRRPARRRAVRTEGHDLRVWTSRRARRTLACGPV